MLTKIYKRLFLLRNKVGGFHEKKKLEEMGLHGMLVWMSLIGLIISPVLFVAASLAKPADDCPKKCGDVKIPYPFGLNKDCSLNEDFLITCDNKVAKTGNLTIKNISIEAHDLRVLQIVARDCYNQNGVFVEGNEAWLNAAMNTISKAKNKFTVVGCDTYAFLHGVQNGEHYSIGCMSICESLRNVVNGSCSGVGCCEVAIPDGLKDMLMEVHSFHNHKNVSNFNPCSYAFVVEQGQFNFSSNYLRNFSHERLPMVLKWAIGNETCGEAAKKNKKIVCKGNSKCSDLPSKLGYRCHCNSGYRGNPYLPHGCQGLYYYSKCLVLDVCFCL